jgi:hypothetical protein
MTDLTHVLPEYAPPASNHPPLCLVKDGSGYWRGTYRGHPCVAVKRRSDWQAQHRGIIEQSFRTLDEVVTHLTHRIDRMILSERARLNERRAAEANKLDA